VPGGARNEKSLAPALSTVEFPQTEQAHSVIERLSSIVFPSCAKERNMAMYSAYFDESTGNGSPVYVVAGFLSNDALWVQFEKEWKAVLSEFKITAFHAQHFAKHKKQFLGWDEPKRQRLLSALLDIIQRRAQFGFAAVVHAAAFRDVFKGKDRIEVGSVYRLGCTCCFSQVGEWAQKNYQIEPIAHCFDAGNKNAGDVLKTYQDIKSRPDRIAWRLGPIAFESDDVLVPLQAADLAAYEIWKWLDEHFAQKIKHGRHPFHEIVRIPWKIREFDRSILQEMLDVRNGKRKPEKRTVHNFISVLPPGVVGEKE